MKFFWEVFVTLFVVIDPPGTVPIFLGLTSGRTTKERNRLAWQAALVALGVIVVFALFGQLILAYLGVQLAALQGAGGLLLLLVALQLLTGTAQAPTEAERRMANIAFVPLGTPLLAGPGAIVATMLFVKRINGAADAIAFSGALVAVSVMLWLFMRYCDVVVRVLRPSGVELLTRVSGLLVSAIAVQLIAGSVEAFVRAAHLSAMLAGKTSLNAAIASSIPAESALSWPSSSPARGCTAISQMPGMPRCCSSSTGSEAPKSTSQRTCSNSANRPRHPASGPVTASGRRRACGVSTTSPEAPPYGSRPAKCSRVIVACTAAPRHMQQGSSVVSSRWSS
jgi:multiple antibiotic resistance protein